MFSKKNRCQDRGFHSCTKIIWETFSLTLTMCLYLSLSYSWERYFYTRDQSFSMQINLNSVWHGTYLVSNRALTAMSQLLPNIIRLSCKIIMLAYSQGSSVVAGSNTICNKPRDKATDPWCKYRKKQASPKYSIV